jgi:hypothetical protein
LQEFVRFQKPVQLRGPGYKTVRAQERSRAVLPPALPDRVDGHYRQTEAAQPRAASETQFAELTLAKPIKPTWSVSVDVAVKRCGLTGVATTPGPTPRDSAAAAGSAACTTAPAATAAAASATAATAPPSESFAHLRFRDVFLVEDIERRQAHVGNLLLTEKDFMGRREILRLDLRCRSAGRCRCCARQRKCNPGESQHGQGFPSTISLRSLLRSRHLAFSLNFEQMFDE